MPIKTKTEETQAPEITSEPETGRIVIYTKYQAEGKTVEESDNDANP